MTRRFKREGTPGSATLKATQLQTYTVAQLKALAVRPGHLYALSDGASNRPMAVGGQDGVWRYTDGTAV